MPSRWSLAGHQATSARLLAVSIGVGIVTAVVVAAFEDVTLKLFESLLEQPLWVMASAPFVGLAVAKLLLVTIGRGASGATSDEYVRTFHERSPRLPLRLLPTRLLAGVATIGSGGALGLEGPSIYAGSSIGLGFHRRLQRFLRREDAHNLLTAGAAAGVAAIFKAPATGVLFALEAPYRDDLHRQALLPALLASAASYTTFVALVGSESVIPPLGTNLVLQATGREGEVISLTELADFLREPLRVDLADLVGAAVLGVVAGLGGRMFAWLIQRAKTRAPTRPTWQRLIGGGVVLAGLAIGAEAAFDAPLTLGPGIESMAWVVEPRASLPLIALLLVMRVAATTTTVAAGGVGGLFIPLATLGVITGQFVGLALGNETGLYPILGLAAFLGAGYRVPIAAVMFVAEATLGAFVVPALVAAAVSQIVAGESSVAEYQRTARRGHLERRFDLPIASALTTDVLTVPPDATITEFVDMHVIGRRQRAVPMVDGLRYLGMVSVDDVSAIDRDRWASTALGSLELGSAEIARPTWTLRDAMAALDRSDLEVLAVADTDDTFVGVVDLDDILRLDELLDETGE